MEAVATSPSTIPQPAAIQQPAASPNYTPPVPPAAPSSENMEESSSGRSNPFKKYFSDINIIDVTISAFIVAAVIYSINYHKFMMMIEKTGYADLSGRVGKLESSMAAAKKSAEVNASGRMGRARRRMI